MGFFGLGKKDLSITDHLKDGGFWTRLLFRQLALSRGNFRNFDMASDNGKKEAFKACIPLNSTITKCGKLFSNGKFYVVDEDNNDVTTAEAKKIIQLLKKPNPLQSGKVFNRQVELTLKLYGRCPIYLLRGLPFSVPVSMWIIPPELFKQTTTGKLWGQNEKSEIIGETYIEWGGRKYPLEEHEYFVVVDSSVDIEDYQGELKYSSSTDAMSPVVNNWMAQAIARGNLIVDGGGKGVICSDDNSDFQNAALTPKERKELNDHFKEDSGFVDKPYPILISTAKLKWLPLSFDVGQLKLHEEDKSCFNHICSAIGLNPNLFIPDSTFSNQDGAQRSAYRDVVIPDAESYAEALTSAICPDGAFIQLDYTHVEVLQKDKKEESDTLFKSARAAVDLTKSGIISNIEARRIMADHIDIDPEKIQGELQNEQTEQNTD